jgi:hypothetical protein
MEEVKKQLKMEEPAKTPEVPQNGAPSQNKTLQGLAGQNPFLTSSLNPLRAGLVEGYDKWFGSVKVVNQTNGQTCYQMNRDYCASAQGAQEALRLVQNFEPAAKLTASKFGSGGGPFVGDGENYEVELPGGARLNAGGILSSYYSSGEGVTLVSDTRLQEGIRLAKTLV